MTQYAPDLGQSLLVVDRVTFDENGISITGYDERGKLYDSVRLKRNDLPIVVPSQGDTVMLDRNANRVYGKLTDNDTLYRQAELLSYLVYHYR